MNFEAFKDEIYGAVGPNWWNRIPEDALKHFIVWAAQCQVYFGDGAAGIVGDAFRGFVTGYEFSRRDHKTPLKCAIMNE